MDINIQLPTSSLKGGDVVRRRRKLRRERRILNMQLKRLIRGGQLCRQTFLSLKARSILPTY